MISHFLPILLISVCLHLRLFRVGVCLLKNILMMCHWQKVRLNQSNRLKFHLYRLKVAIVSEESGKFFQVLNIRG